MNFLNAFEEAIYNADLENDVVMELIDIFETDEVILVEELDQ